MTWDVSSWFVDQTAELTPLVSRRLHAAYLKDLTTNEHDAVGLGFPIFVAGTVADQACEFDGIDDYFAITAFRYESDSIGHPFTLEAYVKVGSDDISVSSLSNDNTIIASFDRDEYWRFGIGSQVDSQFKASLSFLATSDTQHDLSGATDVADGAFHHLAARYDPSTNGGQVKFFVDGSSDSVVDSLGTWWGSPSANRRYGFIGGNSEASVFNDGPFYGSAFKGRMEYFRIWHVARTDTEINSFHDTTSISDTASGLQLHYSFAELGDISDRVMSWPTLRRHWNDLRSQSVTVELANPDGALNAFFRKPQAGLTTFALEFGFTHPTSGDEFINPFVGRLGSVRQEEGKINLTIDDKVAQLSDVVVGDDDNPVTYTDSTLPSDIAWDVLTNRGPFSDVESTSNPDIDWASYEDWSSVFSGDSVFMNAHFDGQKALECLRKVARHTQSAIYMEGGRFHFHRFSAVNTESTDIDADHLLVAETQVDMLELVTKQIVQGAYNVDSEEWGITTFDIDSNSSVSYGLRESVEKDENVWYVNSVSALNLAQRFTTVGGNPYEQVSATTTLVPLIRQVGETISFVDAQTGINKGYRIMGMELNMEDGTMGLNINASQTETPFILDESALDGSDKLL